MINDRRNRVLSVGTVILAGIGLVLALCPTIPTASERFGVRRRFVQRRFCARGVVGISSSDRWFLHQFDRGDVDWSLVDVQSLRVQSRR